MITSKIRSLAVSIFSIRFFRYLFVGATTFAIDLFILFLLHDVFGLGLAFSASVSFWSSIVFNFLANRAWVFSAQDTRRLHEHAVLYGLLLGLNYLYTIVTIVLLTKFMSYGLAKILILIVQIAWTFPIYKYIIFQSHKNTRNKEHINE